MKTAAVILVLAFALPAVAAAPPANRDVVDSSFVTADGARDLQQSIVVEAPVATLWKAFTDAESFRRWNAPVAVIDLRVGGSMEVGFDARRPIGDPDNIRHRVITFLPERLLVYQNIQSPHELPGAELFQRTVIVVQFEPLGPRLTRVLLSSTGWGSDAVSDRLYRFFEADNARELESLKHAFEVARPAGG